MLDSSQAVLLFIDVQGRLAELMHERQRLFDNLNRMLAGCRVLDVPALVTEQNPEKLGPTREEFAENLRDLPVFPKFCFSSAGASEVACHLREQNRRQVILVGIETHICVWQTAVDLLADGYEVFVVADAVGSRHPDNKDLALARLREEGATIVSTEMALMEMLRDSASPAFRDLLKIIR